MTNCSVCIFSLMRLIEFRRFQLTDLAGSFLTLAYTTAPTNIMQPQAPKSPSGLASNSMWLSFVVPSRFLTHSCKAFAAKSEVTPQSTILNLLPDPTSIYTRYGEAKANFERLVVIVERQRTQLTVVLWLRQVNRALMRRIIGGIMTDGPIISWLHNLFKYKINFQSLIRISIPPYTDPYIANLATKLAVVVADAFV